MWSGSTSNQSAEAFTSQVVASWTNMPYMNVPHEQVDWASLAQQWIKMKEEVPQYEKEGGEAPMEIIKEENTVPTPPNPPEWPGNTTDGSTTWSGNWSWSQAGGGWCWNSVTPHLAKPSVPSTFTPSYPTVSDTVTAPIIPQPSTFPYTPPQAPTASDNFTSNHTYWTGATAETKDAAWEANRTIKKHPVVEPTPEIDAAKRKQLPAWIREGLEKMEREKLKKAEQERLEKLRKDELAKQTNLNLVDSNGLVENPVTKSKYETESDDSDHEVEVSNVKAKPEEKPRKSRFDWHEPSSLSVPPQTKFRSKEQILQAVMVDVRKILTQILMEVTTEEIQKAVDEEIRLLKRKAPATTVRKTAALTSLTGKLGLGIYESDSSGSESEPEEKVKNDPDSDQELRERIEKLKNEFVHIERVIEIEALEQEERERKQLRYESLNKEESPSKHEEQVQPLYEGSPESSEKMKIEEQIKENSDLKRLNRLTDNNYKSENIKEINSNSTTFHNSCTSKTNKKLVNNERSYRQSSSSYSSTSDDSSSSSSSSSSTSSRSSSSRHKRRRTSGGGGSKRSAGDRRSSRYSRSRSRSRSRSYSRSRRDRSRHGSACRRRTHRRSSRDRKGRSRRSSSGSSNGRHRSRKSNHRR